MIYPVQASLPGLGEFDSLESGVCEIEDFLENPDAWLARFATGLAWNRRMRSRHTFTFGYVHDPGHGLRLIRNMPGYLEPLLERIHQVFGFFPNNCLVNYYPDGTHYIGFHADLGEEMKSGAGVAIVSLGAVRTMVIRRIENPDNKFFYPLKSGSVIYLKDEIQKTWEHGIPKQAGKGPRISLSFRHLVN